MAYVAVKGGERAIHAAHLLVRQRLYRRGRRCPDVVTALRGQMRLALARVMAEGALYAEQLAAEALFQAQGDLIEAVFLVRAYRATLPRWLDAEPLRTGEMRAQRRISSAFRDLPGGQRLGETYDYSHRFPGFFGHLQQPEENDGGDVAIAAAVGMEETGVMAWLEREGLIETAAGDAGMAADTDGDLTVRPLVFPARRAQRLQALARGDEGFLLSLAYSTQRGYGNSHPFIAELRAGEVEVEIVPPELGFAVVIGTVTVTECQMVNQFGSAEDGEARFTRGYGLALGQSERKAIAMALVDRALRAGELGEEVIAPAQDEEFVLSHCDNVEATGFVEHLKLPHHVDFQAELQTLRHLRKRNGAGA